MYGIHGIGAPKMGVGKLLKENEMMPTGSLLHFNEQPSQKYSTALNLSKPNTLVKLTPNFNTGVMTPNYSGVRVGNRPASGITIKNVKYGSGLGTLGKLGFAIVVIPLATFIALFAYGVYTTKRVNKGDEPGILAKLFRWDTWKLWGNKYSTRSHTLYEAPKKKSEAIKKKCEYCGETFDYPSGTQADYHGKQICIDCSETCDQCGALYPTYTQRGDLKKGAYRPTQGHKPTNKCPACGAKN